MTRCCALSHPSTLNLTDNIFHWRPTLMTLERQSDAALCCTWSINLKHTEQYCSALSLEFKAEKCVILHGTWDRYSHAWTEGFIFKLWKMSWIYKIWNKGIPCLIFALNVTMNDSFCVLYDSSIESMYWSVFMFLLSFLNFIESVQK